MFSLRFKRFFWGNNLPQRKRKLRASNLVQYSWVKMKWVATVLSSVFIYPPHSLSISLSLLHTQDLLKAL